MIKHMPRIAGRCTAVLLASLAGGGCAAAQEAATQQEVRRLEEAVDRAQAQVEASQQQLAELKRSLAALAARVATPPAASAAPADRTAADTPVSPGTGTPSLAENQEAQENQIATLAQAKVESESKYPVTIRGMILLNGFVNTGATDFPAFPGVALPGSGSTGASLRQTFLGINARGPSLAGAKSHADLNVDFLGDSTDGATGDVAGLVRLRTAHASLQWPRTTLFAEFDYPIISPNQPTSLVASAQPALAWAGNLWRWVPQAGVSRRFGVGDRLTLAAALIDTPDSPVSQSAAYALSSSENSRWPGTELHLGYHALGEEKRLSIGVGGYFSPHLIAGGSRYNAWAATLDLRTPLPGGLELSGDFYRGLSLGGLGAGTYKDFVSRQFGTAIENRPLDDVGGWAQLKKRAGERLEFNAAAGLDNSFASELRRFPWNNSLPYGSLARNRSIYGNTIWSPSAYLLFSLEYRYLSSFSVNTPTSNSHILGLAAGYRF